MAVDTNTIPYEPAGSQKQGIGSAEEQIEAEAAVVSLWFPRSLSAATRPSSKQYSAAVGSLYITIISIIDSFTVIRIGK